MRARGDTSPRPTHNSGETRAPDQHKSGVARSRSPPIHTLRQHTDNSRPPLIPTPARARSGLTRPTRPRRASGEAWNRAGGLHQGQGRRHERAERRPRPRDGPRLEDCRRPTSHRRTPQPSERLSAAKQASPKHQGRGAFKIESVTGEWPPTKHLVKPPQGTRQATTGAAADVQSSRSAARKPEGHPADDRSAIFVRFAG